MSTTGVAPAPSRLQTWHPGWLGVVLGTGGAAVASLSDPVGSLDVDTWIGVGLTVVAVALLPVLLVPYVLRARRHRHAVAADISHPGTGALFGTLPAALLIVGLALAMLGVQGRLPAAATAWVALVLVLLGVLGALVVGVEFFGRVVRAEQTPPAAMSGAWFIPIVVLVLVPSVVARLAVLEPSWATTGAVLGATAAWGAGFVLFLVLAPVLAWRLVSAPAPPPAMAATWWIWLAPAGAGGLGVLALARLAARVVGGPAAEMLPTAGLLAAAVLWGFGTWWALFAGRVLRDLAREPGGLPFHVGSWGFVFPTAAMAALTVELGRSWDVPAVSVVGTVWWVACVLVWVRVAVQTWSGVRRGTIYSR